MSMLDKYARSISPHAIFGNRKTSNRFVSTLETLGKKFGQSIPRSSNNKREMEAIYHFFNSHRVMPESILLSERDRLMDFIAEERPSTLLSIGDVTILDYKSKRSASKMGYVTSKNRPAYNVLSQLFCDGQGVPIGLFDQVYWNYKVEELGQRRQRQQLSIEFKETAHYLQQWESLNKTFAKHHQSRFIHLFDRAGDVHELLQSQENAHIFYIIRSKNDRKLFGKNISVSEMLDGLQPGGDYEFEVNKQSAKKQTFIEIKRQKGIQTESRTAKIEVTFASTTLRASNAGKNRPLKPFQVGIVRAKELDPPADTEAIAWTLFTTLPLNNFEEAMEVIHFYTLRWQIENFHFTLKQGAKVEDLQLEEPAAVLNAIATYSLLAVQVSRLRYLAEKQPTALIDSAGFTIQDYAMLAQFLNAKNNLNIDPQPPVITVEKFVTLISNLGGNHNRKKIGIQSIWWGLQEFAVIKQVAQILSSA